MGKNTLKQILLFVPNPPCNGCHNWNRCADEQLTCSAFRYYADKGRIPLKARKKPDMSIAKWYARCNQREESQGNKEIFA
jgi:hypothetical protein